MIQLALLYIVLASAFVGFMSQLRKKYQMANGIGLVSTLSFILLASLSAAIVGSFFSEGLRFEPYSFVFATGYALFSTVTAALCICGTAFGNLSVLIMYATLGTLIIPSVYGLIVLPEENVLTAWKACGFVAAFVCLALNFWGSKGAAGADVTKVDDVAQKLGKDKSGGADVVKNDVGDSGRSRSGASRADVAERNEIAQTAVIFKVMCAVVFFTNGSALVVYNLENRYCSDYSYYSFVTEYMLISAALLAVVLVILLFKNRKQFLGEAKQVATAKNMGIILLYAILFFASDLLSINCAGMIPLIIQAPVSFCVPVIVVAILDYILYREKLTKRNLLQMAAALVCCICFVVE